MDIQFNVFTLRPDRGGSIDIMSHAEKENPETRVEELQLAKEIESRFGRTCTLAVDPEPGAGSRKAKACLADAEGG